MCEGGCGLEVVVEVWFAGVAGVTTEAEEIAGVDGVAWFGEDGVLFEVCEEGEFAVLVIDDDVVTGRIGGVHFAGRVVGEVVGYGDDDAWRGGEDRLVEAVVVIVGSALVAMGGAVFLDEEIVGEALVGRDGVVVVDDVASAPGDGPGALEGKGEMGFGGVIEARGGRGRGGGFDEEACDFGLCVEGPTDFDGGGGFFELEVALVDAVGADV